MSTSYADNQQSTLAHLRDCQNPPNIDQEPKTRTKFESCARRAVSNRSTTFATCFATELTRLERSEFADRKSSNLRSRLFGTDEIRCPLKPHRQGRAEKMATWCFQLALRDRVHPMHCPNSSSRGPGQDANARLSGNGHSHSSLRRKSQFSRCDSPLLSSPHSQSASDE